MKKLPDAIVAMDKRLYAIEVLPEKTGSKERKWEGYKQFDAVIFVRCKPKSFTIRYPDSLKDTRLP